MPKQEGQKSKLLALLRIFEQQTDENHLLNVPQLVELLEAQCRKFRPELAVLFDEAAAEELKRRLSDMNIKVAGGMDGLLAAAVLDSADTVVTAVSGMIGLRPTLAAIERGKRIALANKETLVCAGELVMREAQCCGAEIIPVDSEHSAIFQCLMGCRDRSEVRHGICPRNARSRPRNRCSTRWPPFWAAVHRS